MKSAQNQMHPTNPRHNGPYNHNMPVPPNGHLGMSMPNGKMRPNGPDAMKYAITSGLAKTLQENNVPHTQIDDKHLMTQITVSYLKNICLNGLKVFIIFYLLISFSSKVPTVNGK